MVEFGNWGWYITIIWPKVSNLPHLLIYIQAPFGFLNRKITTLLDDVDLHMTRSFLFVIFFSQNLDEMNWSMFILFILINNFVSRPKSKHSYQILAISYAYEWSQSEPTKMSLGIVQEILPYLVISLFFFLSLSFHDVW